MFFLKKLFGFSIPTSVVLLDIGAESIGGAYVLLSDADTPSQVIYQVRRNISPRTNEDHITAMERTLEELGAQLVREGTPSLLRKSGSGHANFVLVSISAPWQETRLHTKQLIRKDPFIFTKDLLVEHFLKSEEAGTGRTRVDTSAIGVLLNGYSTQDPFGKLVNRATVTMLTSTIATNAVRNITKSLRRLFHMKEALVLSEASLHYQAIRLAFPHEKDSIIFDASGQELAISLVRAGQLVGLVELRRVTRSEDTWAVEARAALHTLSKQAPLPSRIFLISNEDRAKLFKDALAKQEMQALWLAGKKPSMTAVLTSHLQTMVKLDTDVEPDTRISLMARYANKAFQNGVLHPLSCGFMTYEDIPNS